MVLKTSRYFNQLIYPCNWKNRQNTRADRKMPDRKHTRMLLFFLFSPFCTDPCWSQRGWENIPIPAICKRSFHAVPERLHTILQIKAVYIFFSSADRIIILMLYLEKGGDFQGSAPTQHLNTCLVFSGTIYKCISSAGVFLHFLK